jgi:sigma-B regulation protein RsbU (phosphoserine phosphatase)
VLGGRRFDLVLLDVMMPGMNGLEVLKFLRRMDSLIDLPIVMVTARNDSGDVVEALELGANDYVAKPLDLPVVLARIRTQLSLRRAVGRATELEQRLDARNRELEAVSSRLASANEQTARDLEAAARIQRASQSPPAGVPGYRFAQAFEPGGRLAAGRLDVFAAGDGRLGLCVLGVRGGGVAAALLAETASRLLARAVGGAAVPPGESAARLSRQLSAEATAGHVVTMLYGVLGLDGGDFRFVCAGHPGPVHLPAGGPAAPLEVTGLPLGVGAQEYREQAVTLHPGDRLVLYSDGATTARGPEGEHFGMPRFLGLLEQARAAPLSECPGALARALDGWRGGCARGEDVLALLIERSADGGGQP